MTSKAMLYGQSQKNRNRRKSKEKPTGFRRCVCSRCGRTASAPPGRKHRHCKSSDFKGTWASS